MKATHRDVPLPSRQQLRQRLLEERAQFAGTASANAAALALGRELRRVIAELEPQCLGLYWPRGSEFNAPAVFAVEQGLAKPALALPFAHRTPPRMDYRLWDGEAPRALDECGIAASDGPATVPDVVVVPCVGYTESGFRLGYGGGYFDRWLAQHCPVCAVGVAWSAARLDEAVFGPQPHDIRLAFVVTERGPV
ncbi:MAG: 5-formyltetrahydrofolate cyclo-ligase [Pseudomonadota bacterium]|nr:5-formyltetrahydrofolate cyclo-ligase [Pseudomonadota bacterium]